jgi:hypothetical protein
MPNAMATAHLAAGLLIGWWLARADASRRQQQQEEQQQQAPGAAPADAAADPADAAPAAATPTTPSPLSSSASASSTAVADAVTPAPAAGSTPSAPPRRQSHPSLEHAIASANIKSSSGGGDGAADAATPPTLDLSTPAGLHALCGGPNGLGPLRVAQDGRPLVAFDLEATGLSIGRDRIVEIAAVKVFPDGKVEVKGPQRLYPGDEAAARMPPHVVELHGLSAEVLKGEPRFEHVAGEWREFMRGCDLCGYNALRYDVPLLR